MGDLISSLIPLAAGTLLSPLAIMAMIAILLSHRPRDNGIAFSIGWTAAVGGILVVVLVVASFLTIARPSAPPTWVPIVHVIIGATLVLSAIWFYRRAHSHLRAMAQATGPNEVMAAAPQLPGWLKQVEDFRPMRCLVMGFALCAFNPVDLSCVVGAGIALRVSTAGVWSNVTAGALFVVIGAIPAVLPLAIYLTRGAGATPTLEKLRAWIAAHNGALTSGLFGVIGVLQLIKGIKQF